MSRILSSEHCPLNPPLARHYHSSLSIWLSVDPMSDKYPSMSPYTYCANNPVRLVDPDGEDYIVVIDESQKDNKKIIIKAHYKVYGTQSEYDNAYAAVTEWNNQSGKYVVKTDNDEYTIDFDLSIEHITDINQLSKTDYQDNTINFVDKLKSTKKGAIGEALPGKNGGQSKIQMLKEGNEKQPIMHEIGHTLGLNHSDGVMNKFCTYKDEGIFLHHIGGILNHAGFDVTAGKQCAAQIGPYKMVYNKEPFKGELWRK
ncbi:MAG: hypothetical protein J6Y78_00190 [Paludibacteraceae bacterium]|nr:hypothetical protein [Paludibacteraceae bacterium]